MWRYRSSDHGIPMNRTTMLVEAHWRVLKCRYLAMHNRPRMDFLAHLISAQLVQKYTRDYKQLVNCRKKDSWWKEFVKRWKELAVEPTQNTYETSLEQWWCTCLAFRCDLFLLCKHLCKLRSMPTYREIIRSRIPPFYTFRHEIGRQIPLLDGLVITNREFLSYLSYQSCRVSATPNLSIPKHNTCLVTVI